MSNPTMLFCDLVGSTALLSRVGNVRNEQLRRRYFSALRAGVRATGGEEVKNLGDGLMVVFRSTPDSALSAAEAMHRSLFQLSEDEHEDLRIRVGIASGEATWVDGDWFGPAVNVAARLCAKALASQTLVTSNIATPSMGSAGSLELKGIPEPVPTSVAAWEPSSLPAVLAIADRVPLAGRSVELAALTAGWSDRAGGRIVVVAGLAGAGKTRLVREFVRSLPSGDARVAYRRAGTDEPSGVADAGIIVADDLHLAGTAEVAELVTAFENSPAGRLLVAVGRDDTDGWIRRLRAARGFVIELGPLPVAAVAELLGPYEAMAELVATTTAGNAGYVNEARTALDAAPPGADLSVIVDHTCPYRGLAAFRPSDADLLFGRDAVVEEILERLGHSPVVGVLGPSGSGKSSIVNAGVIPRLRGDGASVVTIRPGRDDFSTIGARSPDVIVVDQFEEVYTLLTAEQRGAFLVGLEQALALGVRIVASLRADFYGHLADGTPITQRLADHHVLVGAMNATELTTAIERPAFFAGYQLEPGLVEVVIGDMAGQPGALPLLSHALRETWLRREGRQLTLAGYRACGGITGAIALTAERVHQRLTPQDQVLVGRLLCRLIALGEGTEDTRRRVPRSELPVAFGPVVDLLAEARLLTLDETDVEISHEALIREWPRFRAWLTDDRDDLRTHQHLTETARTWAQRQRDPAELYRGARLVAAHGWAERTAPVLSPTEEHFLAASRRRELRGRRARLAAVSGLAVLLVASLIATGLAVRAQRNADASATRARTSEAEALANATEAEVNADRAEEQRVDAELRRIAFEARTLAAAQPDLGMLLAAEVYERRPGVEADSALLSTLQANPYIDRVIDLGLPDNARLVELVGSAPLPLVAATDSTAVVIDGSTLTPTGVRWELDGIPTVVISPDGLEATTVTRTGRVERHDLATGELLGQALQVEPGAFNGRATPAAYLADGVLALANGSTLELWDGVADSPEDRITFEGRIQLLTADPTGRQLLVSLESPPSGTATIVLDVGSGVTRALGAPVSAAGFGRDGRSLYVAQAVPPYLIQAVDPVTGSVVAASSEQQSLLLGLVTLETGELLGLTATLGVLLFDADLATSTLLSVPAPIFPTGSLEDGRATGFAGTRMVVIDPGGTSNALAPTGLTGSVALSASGNALLVVGSDGARLHDPVTLAPSGPVIPVLADSMGWSIAVAPDGSLVAGVVDRQVTVFDAATGAPIGQPIAAGLNPLPAFSSDGLRLAVTGPTGLDVYAVPSLELVGSYPVPGAFGLGTVWSPGSDALVHTDVATLGHYVDLETGTVEPFAGQWGAFSADGQRMAAFAFGEATRLIDRSSGEETLLTGFRELGFGVFLPDGDRILRMTLSGTFDLVDLATSSRVGELFTDQRGPNAAVPDPPALLSDGSAALLGAPGTEVMRVELSADRWFELACAAAGRNLTRAEWDRYFGAIAEYDVTCAEYPPGS